jgi:hypothetical protein
MREDPADRGHEDPVATAKLRPAHVALEDHQLVTKDHELDLGFRSSSEEPAVNRTTRRSNK